MADLGGWLGVGWWEALELVSEEVDAEPLAEACSTAASRSVTVSNFVERPETREMSCWSSDGWLVLFILSWVESCRWNEEPVASALPMRRRRLAWSWGRLRGLAGGLQVVQELWLVW